VNPFSLIPRVLGELESICARMDEALERLRDIRMRLDRIDGRLDRLELYAKTHLPDYPAEGGN
jgi:hypothetical protein